MLLKNPPAPAPPSAAEFPASQHIRRLVENVSRADQRVVAATLASLPKAAQSLDGPAVILYGLAPRHARPALSQLKEAQA